ncbi:MAG: H-X9-DG-CTERM domain-containing protein [bacterium]
MHDCLSESPWAGSPSYGYTTDASLCWWLSTYTQVGSGVCQVLEVHNGGLNFLFLDGHVKWAREGEADITWFDNSD